MTELICQKCHNLLNLSAVSSLCPIQQPNFLPESKITKGYMPGYILGIFVPL